MQPEFVFVEGRYLFLFFLPEYSQTVPHAKKSEFKFNFFDEQSFVHILCICCFLAYR
jgi:hypothetical protein